MRIIAKVGALCVKEVEKKDGSGWFCVLEKSRKNEQTGQWENQSIIIKPSEFPAVSELLLIAFATIAKEQAQVRNDAKVGM